MDLIKELFISKELAILAVKNGFNEPVIIKEWFLYKTKKEAIIKAIKEVFELIKND